MLEELDAVEAEMPFTFDDEDEDEGGSTVGGVTIEPKDRDSALGTDTSGGRRDVVKPPYAQVVAASDGTSQTR